MNLVSSGDIVGEPLPQREPGDGIAGVARDPAVSRPHEVDPPALSAARPLHPLPAAAPLPVPLTPLVGRDELVASIREQFLQPEVRLVTLTGPGGVGKSRVAIAAADLLHAAFPDGVRLVRLPAVRDPAHVIPTVAASLGVRESGSVTIFQAVQAALRERALLLVLDNFEQVIAAAPLLADLLRACPG